MVHGADGWGFGAVMAMEAGVVTLVFLRTLQQAFRARTTRMMRDAVRAVREDW